MTTDQTDPPQPFAERAASAIIETLCDPGYGSGFYDWWRQHTIAERDVIAAAVAVAIDAQDREIRAAHLTTDRSTTPRAALLDVADRLEPLVPATSISGRAIVTFIRSTASEYPETPATAETSPPGILAVPQIETCNDQAVGVNGDAIVVLRPKQRMTPTDARRHAAWLVEMAAFVDPAPVHTFKAIRRAVRNT